MLSLVFITLSSLSANAFTLNNSTKLTFSNNVVKVNIANGNCSNIGINESELLNLVQDVADQYWNTTSTSSFKLLAGKIVDVKTAYKTDLIFLKDTSYVLNLDLATHSEILITCNNNPSNFNKRDFALTVVNNVSGNSIVGSLIVINDQATNQFKTKSHSEKLAIIAHELGHAFGLGHSPVKDSLMYYPTHEMRNNLGQDDINGISYLYPKK